MATGIVFSVMSKKAMEENKNQQEQDNNNNGRELDKNKTVDSPGSEVVDYGRSEQTKVKETEQGDREASEDASHERK